MAVPMSIAEIVDDVFERFGVEPHKDLDQSKVRSMMIEAAAGAAGEAWAQRATVLAVQPGDVLIVRADRDMPLAALDRLRQALLIHLRPFEIHDVIVTNTIDWVTVVRREAASG